MKRLFEFKHGIVFWSILLLLAFCATKSHAQIDQNKPELKVFVDVYLDNTKIESDNILVSLTDLGNKQFIKITDQFTTFLDSTRPHNMYITHPKFNTYKLVIAPSNVSDSLNVKVYLNSTNKNVYNINYKYDTMLNKYITYQ